MTTATGTTRGTPGRVGRSKNPRSYVGNLKGEVARRVRVSPAAGHNAQRGGWRLPHRSRREYAGLALWWLVMAVGVTIGASYMIRQR